MVNFLKNNINKFPVIGAAIFLTGCASITSESTQLIRVDALDQDGVLVEEAACELQNDVGVFKLESGKHATVRKSGKDLNIVCESEEIEEKALGTAVSRASAGLYGNIIFGGGVGAIIDHNRGTAYNYPEWMQVIFGETLVFDRKDHEDGVPMKGTEPATEE